MRPQTFDTKLKFVLQTAKRDHRKPKRLTIDNMERKIFWGAMTILGLIADLILPLWWAVGATIPIIYFSWWIAYRSGWFE
jgi:hypothetical protein